MKQILILETSEIVTLLAGLEDLQRDTKNHRWHLGYPCLAEDDTERLKERLGSYVDENPFFLEKSGKKSKKLLGTKQARKKKRMKR